MRNPAPSRKASSRTESPSTARDFVSVGALLWPPPAPRAARISLTLSATGRRRRRKWSAWRSWPPAWVLHHHPGAGLGRTFGGDFFPVS